LSSLVTLVVGICQIFCHYHTKALSSEDTIAGFYFKKAIII